jgi:hypothetical protein
MADPRSRLRRLAGRIGRRLVAQYHPTSDEEREAIRVAAEYRALARMLMDGARPDSPLALSRRIVSLRVSARRELAPLKASRVDVPKPRSGAELLAMRGRP